MAICGGGGRLAPRHQPLRPARRRERQNAGAANGRGLAGPGRVAAARGAVSAKTGSAFYGDLAADSLAAALAEFLGQAAAGDYVALHAWFTPDDEGRASLQALREELGAAAGLATTLGFGPRFLHSTGQLHKGDGGRGLFLQLTADTQQELAIPGEGGMGFGVLKQAQALGDREALLAKGRRVLRLDLGPDVNAGLAAILARPAGALLSGRWMKANGEIVRLKQRAAARALELVEPGMVLGLGEGSTSLLAIQGLGAMLAAGEMRDVVGIPSSRRVEGLARELGIPLSTLEAQPQIDLTIDGADEVDPQLDLIKGGGGALLREKIIARATQREVIIVDDSKLVTRLGSKWAIPVEVEPFGHGAHLAWLRSLGSQPTLRLQGGQPFRTDGGNFIIDCDFGPLGRRPGAGAGNQGGRRHRGTRPVHRPGERGHRGRSGGRAAFAGGSQRSAGSGKGPG